MSQRHAFEPAEDAVLDAARACVLAVGFRRTTFSDVARRAGVSRMTLYRRFPDLETLLSSLMTREFGRVVE
ncbi:MAG: helix-turn-helix domain-containing protein, partial [Solirubrobacteraceae bacterium]